MIDTSKMNELPEPGSDYVWTRVLFEWTDGPYLPGADFADIRHRRDMSDLKGEDLRGVIRARAKTIAAEEREQTKAYKKERADMERRHADELRILAARR